MEFYLWRVHSEDPYDQFDADVVYENHKNLFSIRLFHGGKFDNYPGREYVGGRISYIDQCDLNDFGKDVLDEMIKTVGYIVDDVWYCHFRVPHSHLDIGLRALEIEADFVKLGEHVRRGAKLIDVYMEHEISRVLMDNELENNEMEEQFRKTPVTENVTEAVFTKSHQIHQSSSTDFEGSTAYFDSEEKSYDSQEERDAEDSDSDFVVDDTVVEDVEVDLEQFKLAVDFDVSESMGWMNDDQDEIDDVELEQKDLDDFESNSEDDELGLSLPKAMRRRRRKAKRTKGSDKALPFYVGQVIENKDLLQDMVKRVAVETRRQLFIMKNDLYRFRVVCLGDNSSIDGGANCKIDSGGPKGINMSPKRVSIPKQPGLKPAAAKKPRKKNPVPICNWVLHVSRKNLEDCWVVKTMNEEHACMQTRDVRLLTMSFLVKEIIPILESNPTIPINGLVDQIQKKHQVQVSTQKVVRAKVIAIIMIMGNYQAQFSMLRDYCEELVRANPGTTVKLDVEPEVNPTALTRQFRRIYICFQALKIGFKLGGRDLLGLDGCFINGPYPGQVLSAVGVDANNGIYPVVYAIVEAETFNSWSWFLELLKDDLELPENANFSFITDRQKGLIPALEKVFPYAEHRYCLRHIHENMKKNWRENVMKNMLWKCASVTTKAQFTKALEDIRAFDRGLYKWLEKIPYKSWCRSYFSGRAKCDVLLNNLCEVFNKQLCAAGEKPVLTCLEMIREYLSRRICTVQRVIARSKGPLTTATTKVFEEIKKDASQYNVLMTGPSKYKVNGPWGNQCVVDMDKKECTCRKWELTGIPCKHVVAVIWDMGKHGIGNGIPETWVSPVYYLDTWKEVYMHTIEPIPSREFWNPSSCPTTLIPPKHHKPIGRPRKMRRRTLEEVQEQLSKEGKLTRKGVTVTCALCNKQGHNKRTCKGQSMPQPQSGKENTEPSTIDASQGHPMPSQDSLEINNL